MHTAKFKMQTVTERGGSSERPPRVHAVFAFCILAGLLVLPARASAQLLAANDGPIVYGHHHVNATDPAAHKKFWADSLGGTVVKVGTDGREVIRIPNVWIFMRTQPAKGSSKGSTADHIGFSVKSLQQTLDRIKANGFRVATAAEAPASYNVKGDIANPGPGTRLAFVFGPDDVKVELLEATDQAEPIRLHHVHFFGEQNTAMRDWYVKVFGATPLQPQANAQFLSATLPGLRLNFSPSTTPTVATAGRVVDHIGFEVKNLQEFLARLETQGIKPSVTFRRVDALGINIAFIVDPWGTNIELTEGLDKLQ
jgi:catechol 2,3-dioxygenase-like lactoylglutathione lyase family enzyme